MQGSSDSATVLVGSTVLFLSYVHRPRVKGKVPGYDLGIVHSCAGDVQTVYVKDVQVLHHSSDVA